MIIYYLGAGKPEVLRYLLALPEGVGDANQRTTNGTF